MAEVVTTALMAVNVLLDVISESPVLTTGENADSTAALVCLEEVSVRIQAKGWMFNTHTEDLTINGSGKFPLGTSVCRFDWPRTDIDDPDLVLRFNSGTPEPYDRKNNATTFEVGKVFKDCEITSLLDFDRLPESARQYIMISAARVFQARKMSSATRERFSYEQEQMALADMKREELQSGDYNIFQTFIPNIVRRRNPPLYRTY